MPRGRPKLPMLSSKSAYMSVRVTPTQKKWLKARADRLSSECGYTVSMSSVVLRLLMKEIRAQAQ